MSHQPTGSEARRKSHTRAGTRLWVGAITAIATVGVTTVAHADPAPKRGGLTPAPPLSALAIAPSSVLETASRTTRLQADLSSVQWVSLCDEIAGPPLGIIDLTFTPDGFMRTRTTGTLHRWLPNLVVHSVGTSEEESVQVSGQLLNAVTPVQFISGQVSVSNTRFMSIERR